MTKLTKEIDKAKEENKPETPPDLDKLSEIVETELDNVAGGMMGGYSQYEAKHGSNVAAM